MHKSSFTNDDLYSAVGSQTVSRHMPQHRRSTITGVDKKRLTCAALLGYLSSLIDMVVLPCFSVPFGVLCISMYGTLRDQYASFDWDGICKCNYSGYPYQLSCSCPDYAEEKDVASVLAFALLFTPDFILLAYDALLICGSVIYLVAYLVLIMVYSMLYCLLKCCFTNLPTPNAVDARYRFHFLSYDMRMAFRNWWSSGDSHLINCWRCGDIFDQCCCCCGVNDCVYYVWNVYRFAGFIIALCFLVFFPTLDCNCYEENGLTPSRAYDSTWHDSLPTARLLIAVYLVLIVVMFVLRCLLKTVIRSVRINRTLNLFVFRYHRVGLVTMQRLN